MPVYKRPGAEVYSYDFRYRGARFSGSTGCKTKREAERVEQSIREEEKNRTADRSKPMTFDVASSLYWDEIGIHHRNAVDTERHLAWLLKHVGKKTLVSTISNAVVAATVAKRRGEGVSNATVNRSVCEPMRAMLRRCAGVWGQTVKPIEWRRHFLPESQERVREASQDEETAMLAAIREDYRPALRFALMTGCRRAEIVGLEWSKVDFFNSEFTVTGKGDRTRSIPMSGQVRALLWSLKDHHPIKVFTYQVQRVRDGRERGERRPITMEGFKTEWRRAMDRTDVADFRFHDTRHTAATRLVRATGNIKQAQRLLGHTQIATTSRYAHVTMDDLRAGLDAANNTGNATEGSNAGGKSRKKLAE